MSTAGGRAVPTASACGWSTRSARGPGLSGVGRGQGGPVLFGCPRRGLACQRRVVSPSQQLPLRCLHVLTQFEQAERQLAPPPSLCFRRRLLELFGLPALVGRLKRRRQSDRL